MGDLVNFNKARKARLKIVATATAEGNRAKFGRTKSQKGNDKAEKMRADKKLDGAKLDD